MAHVFNNWIMKNYKILLIVLAAIFCGVMNSSAQQTGTFENKTGTSGDSASYPNVNTPNHNDVPPVIHGTFDDPKIIPDSSGTKRDNRSRENPDSVRAWQRKQPGNDPLKKDTLP
jgi:hypothetical protein